MKTTGIIRNIDELGRLVIPKEMRIHLSIDKNSPVEITMRDDEIVIKKSTARCIICDSCEGLTDFRGKSICAACRSQLAEEAKN